MQPVPDQYRNFWQYLSSTQRDLILEGNYLMNEVIRKVEKSFRDYSFLVFPYAKAYEGFLKQLFLDVGYINHLDYISDHLRLGKLLSPNLVARLGERSLFLKLKENGSAELADKIWSVWKTGRNEVFHYYPHNIRMITFAKAESLINLITGTMEEVYIELEPHIKKDKRTQVDHVMAMLQSNV